MVQDNEVSPTLNRSHYSLLGVVMLLLKNPSAMLEPLVGSLGWEDSPGKGNSYPLQHSLIFYFSSSSSLGLKQTTEPGTG